MNNGNDTDWGKSVAGIVIKDNKVLLARHTYGGGKGKLIIPGGYISKDETPEDAVKREVLEETGVVVEPLDLVGIRFNLKDWYAVFLAEYISGEARSDGDENSEVVWIDVNEALVREDVPGLTKTLLAGVIKSKDKAFKKIPYAANVKNGPQALYGLE